METKCRENQSYCIFNVYKYVCSSIASQSERQILVLPIHLWSNTLLTAQLNCYWISARSHPTLRTSTYVVLRILNDNQNWTLQTRHFAVQGVQCETMLWGAEDQGPGVSLGSSRQMWTELLAVEQKNHHKLRFNQRVYERPCATYRCSSVRISVLPIRSGMGKSRSKEPVAKSEVLRYSSVLIDSTWRTIDENSRY